jgi:hypothetical protein
VPTKMLYQYIVVLKNENKRYINAIGLFLSVLSALLFLKEQLLAEKIILPYLLGIIFIIGLLIWNYFIYRKGDKEVYFSKGLLIAGIVWTKMPYFEWLVFVFIALALLEYQAKYPLEIGFSRTHIIFNTLFKKKYNWSDVNNVILKDGLLTLDFTNNRIFQKEIDEGESEASEEEFNAWCTDQLERK